MSATRFPWIPLRESLGDSVLDAALESAAEANYAVTDDDIGFRDSVSPEVAAVYDRLQADPAVSGVMERLRRRGLDDLAIEIIYRQAALVLQDWRSEANESWSVTVRRRKALKQALLRCATLVEDDVEMGGFWLGVGGMGFAGAPLSAAELAREEPLPGYAMAFSDLLKEAASYADPGEHEHTDAERTGRPLQAISLKTYVLRAIFNLLQLHLAEDRRAPNREAEILASAILQTPIKPGTLTQTRKQERRRYCRERPTRPRKQ